MPDRSRRQSWGVGFDVDPGGMQVLVCVRAKHVSSAWIGLGKDLLARPDDFEPQVTKLSFPAWVEEGQGRLSARLEGKPGSELEIRVLADPAAAPATRGSSSPSGRADAPSSGPSGGGGNPGALASLASLAALLARRRRHT